MSDITPTTCRLNRCGRPLGIGTHMSITGYGRGADETIPVCEEHWQVLRPILPVPTERAPSCCCGAVIWTSRGSSYVAGGVVHRIDGPCYKPRESEPS